MATQDKTRNKAVCYPFASTMEDMRPSTRLKADVDEARESCDAAFATAFRYSRGRDLVEEMVASRFWPLAKENRPK